MTADALKQLLVLANDFKEGDVSVGGTKDVTVRADARQALRATSIGAIRKTPLVDDGVTALLEHSRDRELDAELDALTIARLKEMVLTAPAATAARLRNALPSEAIAALVKIMTNDELSSVASGIFNPLGGEGVVVGAPQHFGSRIQPNSPGDDETEILFSVLEGLTHGCGDVIIGLNPAADDLDDIIRLEHLLEQIVRRLDLPTRYCVLSDIVKQDAARAHARIDVGFQSLAGTSRALLGMIGLDAAGVLDLARRFDGLYFETGQGSAVTNGAAEGVDMVTLESRAYGVARAIRRAVTSERGAPWMIVNDVAGFIGPEVFRTADQLERACLEDVVMAKLHGITMGLDVCATFHMGIAPGTLQGLTERIVRRAAPAYLMAIAGNADPMLGYLTTSFREHPRLRQQTSRRMTTRMEGRLRMLDALDETGEPRPGMAGMARLYAMYAKAGGDTRGRSALEEEGRRRVHELIEAGFDVGGLTAARAAIRTDAIYSNATSALHATLDDGVIADAASRPVRVRTAAGSRDEYLAHPSAGERLHDDDVRVVSSLKDARAPHVQIVVSDGLNANAINEQLRALLPPLRRLLSDRGHVVSARDVVVRNGRVRVGYEIGRLVQPLALVHLLGERPGTGLNMVSAYLTYGRSPENQWRWSRDLDHSATTAVCGIHPRGKAPDRALEEIASLVARMLERRCSGVALAATHSDSP